MNTKDVMIALSRMHSPEEWAFFEEMRIGTGFGKDSEQRLDAWAINYRPSNQFVAKCFELKVSKSDFQSEMKKPLKRRAGLRLSNEFWFVTPKNLLDISDIPLECGLLEVDESGSIKTKVPAPFRNTIPPTFRFVASLCRRLDKDRHEEFIKILNMKLDNEIATRVSLQVIDNHIKKWSSYNQGNKEIPDKIVEALKQVVENINESMKHYNNVTKGF